MNIRANFNQKDYWHISSNNGVFSGQLVIVRQICGFSFKIISKF